MFNFRIKNCQKFVYTATAFLQKYLKLHVSITAITILALHFIQFHFMPIYLFIKFSITKGSPSTLQFI